MDVTHDITTVIREHQGLVQRALRRFGVQERDLPDAMQDVFVVVHRRLPTFEGRSRLSTWIYRIAFHVASEQRRRAYRRWEVLVDADATHATCATTVDQEQHERVERVTRALEQLDADKRDVWIGFEVDEQPMAVIAARLGIPLKTAFSRLYAARRDLARRLRECGLSLVVPWWPQRSQHSLTLITTLSATVLLMPELRTDTRNVSMMPPPKPTVAACEETDAPDVPAASLVSPRAERVAEETAAPRRSPTMRRQRSVVVGAVGAVALPSEPSAEVLGDDSARDELVVFRDSEVDLVQQAAPPMQAELPPLPAREPRVQLRGPRSAAWKLTTAR